MHHIDVVHRLLANLIAREPDEVHPVIDLILHVRHARLAIAIPNAVGAIARRHAHHFADHAFTNALDRVHETRLTAVLRARDDGRALRLGRVMCRATRVVARGVETHWFFRENVLFCRHCCGDMNGAKSRRSREDHKINIFEIEHFLIAIDSPEDALIAGRYTVTVLCGQRIANALGLLDIDVGEGNDAHIFVGGERVVGRAGSAPTTTDEADVDDLLRAVGRGLQACKVERSRG